MYSILRTIHIIKQIFPLLLALCMFMINSKTTEWIFVWFSLIDGVEMSEKIKKVGTFIRNQSIFDRISQ